MRMDEEERGVYCNAVGIWVKEGVNMYRERWRPHRWGLHEVVLASKTHLYLCNLPFLYLY